MKIKNIFKLATDFGTFNSREHYVAFALKCLFYIIPAVIVGNYTDITVIKLKEYNIFGDNLIIYIIIQTFIIITTFYLIIIFLSDFTSEFQLTLSGGFFIVLYFGMQTNYIHMIHAFINDI
jgi:hypothetical protein